MSLLGWAQNLSIIPVKRDVSGDSELFRVKGNLEIVNVNTFRFLWLPEAAWDKNLLQIPGVNALHTLIGTTCESVGPC